MQSVKPSDLPGWPRGLREPLAAAYVGLSGSTFRQVVVPQVPAIRLTPSRVVWLREDLDRWLDAKRPSSEPNFWHQAENPWHQVEAPGAGVRRRKAAG